ncbi:Putative Zinc finger protein C25B8.19c [Rhizopus microsporus]|nr:Putative Zinc finger protein C25B8.19c [Rhizopus microsporus]
MSRQAITQLSRSDNCNSSLSFSVASSPSLSTSASVNSDLNRKDSRRNNKKQYPCDKCSKIFNRPSALTTHSYTHTGEKPFQCQSKGCGRRFSALSNLRRHLKAHQKLKDSYQLSSVARLRFVRQLIERSETMLAPRQDKVEPKYPLLSQLQLSQPPSPSIPTLWHNLHPPTFGCHYYMALPSLGLHEHNHYLQPDNCSMYTENQLNPLWLVTDTVKRRAPSYTSYCRHEYYSDLSTSSNHQQTGNTSIPSTYSS